MKRFLFLSLFLVAPVIAAVGPNEFFSVMNNAKVSSGSTLNNGLIASWKFDESSGNASDSVGSITLTANNTPTFTSGKINNAGTFVAASSQYFDGGNQASLSPSSGFSLSLWAKFNSLYDDAHICSTGTYAEGWYLAGDYPLQPKFAISTTGAPSTIVYSTATFNTATWYHIVVTWGSNRLRIYVDGTQNGSDVATSGTMSSSSLPFRVGCRSASATSFLGGQVDCLMMWNRELTASEVTELYNSGSGLQLP